MTIDNKDYKGAKDFNYFLKSTIQYNNPKLFSLALTYISRPGIYCNEITGSTFNNQSNYYEPIFSNDLYSSQFRSYKRLGISLSKYIRMKKNVIITFISLNNIFDTENESSDLYNKDYSTKYFYFYQFRTVYFGIVWRLK